jgi:hypothetical protein
MAPIDPVDSMWMHSANVTANANAIALRANRPRDGRGRRRRKRRYSPNQLIQSAQPALHMVDSSIAPLTAAAPPIGFSLASVRAPFAPWLPMAAIAPAA